MTSIRERCVVPAVLVALAGCSSSSGGGSVALADYPAQSAKVACHRIYTCCDATERATDSDWGATEADCVATMTPELATNIASFQDGISAGRIVYHADRANTCLNNIAALSCADWGIGFSVQYVPGCAHVFDGTVAMGGTCSYDEECASGYCGATGCAAQGAVGDACTSPTGCQDGLYCPVSSGDHCVAAGAIGAACQVGISCQNNNCVIPDGASSGTCGSPMMCNGQ